MTTTATPAQLYLAGLSSGSQGMGHWLGHRGDVAGVLFCPVSQKGKVRISRLRGESIAYYLKRLRQRAGVDHFSAHDLRRYAESRIMPSKRGSLYKSRCFVLSYSA